MKSQLPGLFTIAFAVLCVAIGMSFVEGATAAPGDGAGSLQAAAAVAADVAADVSDGRAASRQTLMASLFIFVLAVLLGFELITKVPPTLHTPLMSGSNAISGITLVGAVIVAGVGLSLTSVIGLFGVILATVNVVGGFLVTHRMLAMFRKR